ncbi:hypothetical protein CL617_04495 [archaeon]|nr:hypothetical protein [archaeon]|tara:strand:- start:1051 stop:1743 length:693 start_codon:yes stop_codon:yes gene_type:complete
MSLTNTIKKGIVYGSIALSNLLYPINNVEAQENKFRLIMQGSAGVTNLLSEEFKDFNNQPDDISTRVLIGAENNYIGFGGVFDKFVKHGDIFRASSNRFFGGSLSSQKETLENLSIGFEAWLNFAQEGKVIPFISGGVESNRLTSSYENIFANLGFGVGESSESIDSDGMTITSYHVGGGIRFYLVNKEKKGSKFYIVVSGDYTNGFDDNIEKNKIIRRVSGRVGAGINF